MLQPPFMAIGRQLRALREAAGLLQDDLAAKIGITQGAISKAENDKGNPTIDVIERWIAACDGRLFIGRPEQGMETVPSPFIPILRACLRMSESQIEEVRAVVEGLHDVSARDRRLILEIVRNPEKDAAAIKSGT